MANWRTFLSLTFASVAVLFGGGSAHAEPCEDQMPPDVSFVRGVTFEATLADVDRSHPAWAFTFEVGRLYAKPPVPEGPQHLVIAAQSPFTFTTSSCGAVTNVHPGTRYLVSTANLATLDSFSTAIWALDGSSASLVRMYDDQSFDSRLSDATTLSEVLALTVPDLPPTDTPHRNKGASTDLPVWIVMLGSAVFVVSARALRRRPARQHL